MSDIASYASMELLKALNAALWSTKGGNCPDCGASPLRVRTLGILWSRRNQFKRAAADRTSAPVARPLGSVRVLQPAGSPFAASRDAAFELFAFRVGSSGEGGNAADGAGKAREAATAQLLSAAAGPASEPAAWRIAGAIPAKSLADLVAALVAAGTPPGAFELRLAGTTNPPDAFSRSAAQLRIRNRIAVLLFPDIAAFVVPPGVQVAGAQLPDPGDRGLALFAVPFSDADAAGCSLRSAADEWGTSGSRTSRNESLLDPPAFRTEALLRAAGLPALHPEGKTCSVLGRQGDGDYEDLLLMLRRAGSADYSPGGPPPDLAFVVRPAVRHALHVRRVAAWLQAPHRATRFYEFGFPVANPAGAGGYFAEIWPASRGVVAFTYDGLIEAGWEGIEAVVGWIAKHAWTQFPSDPRTRSSPPFVIAIPGTVFRRLVASAKSGTDPREAPRAQAALLALQLAKDPATLPALVKGDLAPSLLDESLVEIVANPPEHALADMGPAASVLVLYAAVKRHSRGRFVLVGKPEAGKGGHGALLALPTAREFVRVAETFTSPV
ncbi:hypothetical protein DFJ74DRAFT_714690 [Hyaloraphidium curvatum]|nr:hypothetical protein DFJ74DRAFT_714690 [Hyaloraphidium curvatum]